MNDKYKLGIDIIDEQHSKIFDLISKLRDNCTEKELIDMINELKNYSEYHFKTEENYFNSIGFKMADEHILLHNQFINTIEYYFDNTKKLKKEKIYIFLLTWIEKHILVEDKKYIKKENIIVNG